jgi:DNA repair protein RadA/Sms
METTYSCASCGHHSHRWFGRCPSCGDWSSAHAASGDEKLVVTALGAGRTPSERIPSGIDEVDRVLGGGLVRGAAILLAGEPGIGKSTLVLQLIDSLARAGRAALLVTGEESVDQVALRGRRLDADVDGIQVAASTSLSPIVAACRAGSYDVLVVDSVQTLIDEETDGAPGGVAQVKTCAAKLVALAKETNTIVILIGHVTKEGSVAGPKTLEHVVDVVLTLEGERSGVVRLLRTSKNRFGSCDETGVFVMGGGGLDAVPDPSQMLLEDRSTGVPGSVVFPGLEGTRPLLVELQALVTGSVFAQPRQIAIGVDGRRISLLLGVLSERAETDVLKRDVFVAAAGGITVREPAADLAICLALLSAHTHVALDPCIVALGEVGLAGEVRRVPGIERRLAEARRMGFTKALVPRGVAAPSGIEVRVAADLRAALDVIDEARNASEARTETARRATLGEVPAAEVSTLLPRATAP